MFTVEHFHKDYNDSCVVLQLEIYLTVVIGCIGIFVDIKIVIYVLFVKVSDIFDTGMYIIYALYCKNKLSAHLLIV